ncbi:MAG: UDP-N-acetylmuramoyl-L-alanyl-D-glutamate--2,6-diaminopimelate ligase [Candidatus Moranbacteria bacterium]|nr:UDP-N-acetylmuramoyl-L-alanyl-D-glutamate--2,6-diaminopimelate ligase [Candidatus Moranbacteria bacterium]
MWQKFKNFYHWINALVASVWFGFPSKKVYVIGVTGTNGKTTVVNLITEILVKAGKDVGMSSTINFRIKDKQWVNKTKFTTTSPFKLQRFMAQCVKAGCEYVVIETSSHALDQNRVWGIVYDLAVLTNITREHFDYHGNMVNYRLAKKRLFQITARKVKKKSGYVVINLAIDKPEEFLLAEKGKNVGYYYKKNNLQQSFVKEKDVTILKPEKVKTGVDKTSFQLDKIHYQLQLPGSFNIENALAAIAVGKICSVKGEVMSRALAEISNIPGRMEAVGNDRGLKIIIDYALTPDSMQQIGSFLQKRQKPGKKLIWIFGSCGNRDRGKRPIMGKIVEKFADLMIITNEDPYNEDPNAIIEEIYAGVKQKQKAKRILSRKRAILEALKIAKTGDTVLITGKGAEENMRVKDRFIQWNDKKTVKKILNSP